ncbi:helix-turn-helix transcriptional regulator [Candidatus Bathyarchaeota archaeon]|nr:helix-turn-helix transcriptional regulator [Candidatus Bathyarchaeota archaeon]
METDIEKLESLEDSVFKALDHQKRRDIIRFVGEAGSATFTEIKKSVDFADSPSLSYHLKSLDPFLEQRESRYSLSYLGKSAYSLLLRTGRYSKAALHYSKKNGTIIGHAVLWAAALAAAAVMGTDSFYYTIIIPTLAGTSLMVIHALFE